MDSEGVLSTHPQFTSDDETTLQDQLAASGNLEQVIRIYPHMAKMPMVAGDMGAETQDWGEINPILDFTTYCLYYTATQVGRRSDNKCIVKPQLDMYNE